MNINRIALISFPVEQNIKPIFQNLTRIGTSELLLLHFDDDYESAREIKNNDSKLYMFSYHILPIFRTNLYSEAIRISIEILLKLKRYSQCNIYFANHGNNSSIIAILDVVSQILALHFGELNRINRRESYPKYSITKCLWQNNKVYEYSFLLYAKDMLILEQIGYLTSENEKITSGGIKRKIEDSIPDEDYPNKPSISTIKDHIRALKKGFYGTDSCIDYYTNGFKLSKEITNLDKNKNTK